MGAFRSSVGRAKDCKKGVLKSNSPLAGDSISSEKIFNFLFFYLVFIYILVKNEILRGKEIRILYK